LAAKVGTHLDALEEALQVWKDERFITRDQLRALALFHQHLVNLSENDGWQYDGHSLKVGHPMCALVVKATIDGIPHVVFSSARTPTGCVVIFVRKLESGLLEWVVDRFRS
jgi:hypothetical protein